jgi:chromosome partitioning protein
MIVAIVNAKGGIGKTTCAVNLAAGIAFSDPAAGVCLVDLDTSGAASLALGCGRQEFPPSIAEALLDGYPLERVIQKTGVPGLSIVPGGALLAGIDTALATVPGREKRLAAALEPLKDRYRFFLIDCPPAISLSVVNALIASDVFFVPCEPKYLAVEGLRSLFDAVKRLGSTRRPDLLGIAVTMADYRSRATTEYIGILRKHFGESVFRTIIRVNTRISEAQAFGKTVYEYAPRSPGASAYLALTEEFLTRSRRYTGHGQSQS